MGNRGRTKTQDQARGDFNSGTMNDMKLRILQSITVIPRKNRLRIYVDGADKYYRLRELKRALPDVVVKVSMIFHSPRVHRAHSFDSI